MQITKDKLPKGLSYPLKTSILEEVLLKEGINVPVHLQYIAGQWCYFEVAYFLTAPNSNDCLFMITVGTVKSGEREHAIADMQGRVLPNFIQWAKATLKLPNDSTKLQTTRNVSAIFRSDRLPTKADELQFKTIVKE